MRNQAPPAIDSKAERWMYRTTERAVGMIFFAAASCAVGADGALALDFVGVTLLAFHDWSI